MYAENIIWLVYSVEAIIARGHFKFSFKSILHIARFVGVQERDVIIMRVTVPRAFFCTDLKPILLLTRNRLFVVPTRNRHGAGLVPTDVHGGHARCFSTSSKGDAPKSSNGVPVSHSYYGFDDGERLLRELCREFPGYDPSYIKAHEMVRMLQALEMFHPQNSTATTTDARRPSAATFARAWGDFKGTEGGTT
jgi:hypothetical protein